MAYIKKVKHILPKACLPPPYRPRGSGQMAKPVGLTKTASRFWFAQGIEAVSFFAYGKKDTSG
jgi:hypothetical protein